MNQTSNVLTNVLNLIGWLFGLLVLAIGVINTFWGNDPGFGVFIFLLAFVFFPPVNAFIKHKTGFSIPRVVKWLLGLFIIFAALGVGELFGKIDLMMSSF
jgi:glucan phosphoethanolaminetransferase (alkaline phosphatase superfamily)